MIELTNSSHSLLFYLLNFPVAGAGAVGVLVIEDAESDYYPAGYPEFYFSAFIPVPIFALTLNNVDGLQIQSLLKSGTPMNGTFVGSGKVSNTTRASLIELAAGFAYDYANSDLGLPSDFTEWGTAIRPFETMSDPLLDPCWDRVLGLWCEDGEVVSLLVSGYGISFSDPVIGMSDALADLQSLKVISMNYNTITAGQLISNKMCEMGMPNLVWIDFYNLITDVDTYNIIDTGAVSWPSATSYPDCFSSSKMPKLYYVDQSSTAMIDIPPGIENAANLFSLNAHACSIANIATTWTSPSLIALTIDFDGINQAFPLFNASAATTISLTCSESQFTSFPTDGFSWLTSMQSLTIQQCEIVGLLPPDAFHSFSGTIQTLNLAGNSFNGSLPSFMTTACAPNLDSIDLSENKFYGSIPTNWKHCSAITSLNLNSNNLNGNISALSNLNNLVNVRMAHNLLSIEASNLPPLYANPAGYVAFQLSATTLKSVDLSYNNLNGEMPTAIWVSMTALEVINLAGNGITSLGDIMFSMPKLKSLDLSNQKGGVLTGSLSTPPSAALTSIDLSGNPNFKGSFPEWIKVQPSFTQQAGAVYRCYSIIGTANGVPISISLDGSYNDYATCSCIPGYYGVGGGCISIPDQAINIDPVTANQPLPLTGEQQVPPYSIADSWFGSNRLLSGVSAVWGIDASNIGMVNNDNITTNSIFYTKPARLSDVGAQKVRLINLYLSINLDTFRYSNDSISVYSGDSSLKGQQIRSFIGTDNLPMYSDISSKTDDQLRLSSSMFQSIYSSNYQFSRSYTIHLPIYDSKASISYNSRQVSSSLFFAAYSYETNCNLYGTHRIDPLSDSCVPIIPGETLPGEPLTVTNPASSGILTYVFAVLGSWTSLILIEQAIHDRKLNENPLIFHISTLLSATCLSLTGIWCATFLSLDQLSFNQGVSAVFNGAEFILAFLPVVGLVYISYVFMVYNFTSLKEQRLITAAATSASKIGKEISNKSALPGFANEQADADIAQQKTTQQQQPPPQSNLDSIRFLTSELFRKYTIRSLLASLFLLGAMIAIQVLALDSMKLQAKLEYDAGYLIGALIIFWVLGSFGLQCFFHLLRYRFIGAFIQGAAIVGANQLVIAATKFVYDPTINVDSGFPASTVTLVCAIVAAATCFILLGLQFSRMKLSRNQLDLIVRNLKKEITQLNTQMKLEQTNTAIAQNKAKLYKTTLSLINFARPLHRPAALAVNMANSQMYNSNFNPASVAQSSSKETSTKRESLNFPVAGSKGSTVADKSSIEMLQTKGSFRDRADSKENGETDEDHEETSLSEQRDEDQGDYTSLADTAHVSRKERLKQIQQIMAVFQPNSNVAKLATQLIKSIPLGNILSNPLCCEIFKDFLDKELSSENIAFWLSVQNYKAQKPDKTIRKLLGEEIYNDFIRAESKTQVNLPSKITLAVTSAVKAGNFTSTIFDDASNDIYKLMNTDSYARFASSPQFLTCWLILNSQVANDSVYNFTAVNPNNDPTSRKSRFGSKVKSSTSRINQVAKPSVSVNVNNNNINNNDNNSSKAPQSPSGTSAPEPPPKPTGVTTDNVTITMDDSARIDSDPANTSSKHHGLLSSMSEDD